MRQVCQHIGAGHIFVIHRNSPLVSKEEMAVFQATRLTLTSAILLVLLAERGQASDNTKNCKLLEETQIARETVSRLEPLTNRTFSATGQSGSDNYTYLFQVCGKAGKDPDGGVVQKDVSGKEVIIGKYTAMEAFGGANWVMLIYRNGSAYSKRTCGSEERNAMIMISCERGVVASDMSAIVEERGKTNNCFYLFELGSSAVCRPIPSRLSVGSILLIVGFSFLAVYLIGGFLYQRLVVGAKGVEQFPHYSFWQEIGNLTADGCDFVCRSRGSREEPPTYRGVASEPLGEEPEERDDHLLPMRRKRRSRYLLYSATMDTEGDQNSGAANGNTSSGGNSRPPQMQQMSLYERQAVQALQALQRQPNAAQYFQQLMFQQQINSAQLHSLAAVQQATLAASRQSSSPSNSVSQATSTAHCTVNLSSSGGGAMTNTRPLGPTSSATSSTLSQPVLLGGNTAGQGQMYLRVNRRAPLASQLIFMPGGTATAAVATVAQHQPQQQQQQQAAATGGHSHLLQYPVRQRSGAKPGFALCFQPQSHRGEDRVSGPQRHSCLLPCSTAPTAAAALLLSPAGFCQARAVTTVTSAATATHILVPTSSSSQVYPGSSAAPKSNVNTQTLVVQPLQQSNTNINPEKMGHTSGPVPIQPKTVQGLRLPLQLPPRHPPPILPAPPSNGQSNASHPPPHVPVQLVGARQGSLGNSQALALAQARSCCAQDSGALNNSTNSNVVTMNTASITVPPTGDSVYGQPVQSQGKLVSGSLKRKSESDVASEMAAGSTPLCAPLLREVSPPLSAPAIDSAGTASPSPPALSLSRAGGGQGERAPPPQAVVKPQVLTHLIEGFVIQEGAEPFPVTGPVKERAEGAFPIAVPPTGPAESEAPTVMKCEYCEGFAPANQFRGSKRFCSMTCAKRYNVSCSHQFRTRRGRAARGRHLPVKCRSESSRSEDISSCEEEEEEDSLSLSPGSSFSCPRPAHCGPQLDGSTAGGLPIDGSHFLSGSPSHWSVEDVCQFISSLQGCEDLASQFLSQEIDGQALLLLREEHLMSTMNIKLGPALKICASINNLRD
ncbi:hypothetical protein AAFF_G00070790 [Aldrovandia affinis]|uniref:Uncharacterized protein n=1 Tax=Aldrovandia affinis TaxID=143900 RepID=A0AAD7RYX1_9TELE|nr:hypothetical protein AAFF_G00070790 [Aldrovandia affinis]